MSDKSERSRSGSGDYRMEAHDNPMQSQQVETMKKMLAMRAVLLAGRSSAKLRELDLILGQEVLRMAANAVLGSERNESRTACLEACLDAGPCWLTPSTLVMIQAALTTEETLRLGRAAHH